MSENSTGAAAVVGGSGAENVSTKQAKLWAFLMAFDRYRKTPRLSIESVSVAFDDYMGAPDDPPPAAPSDSFRAALNEFMEKLDWVYQKRDWPFGSVGMHIADVITRYVRCLESDAKRDAKRYRQAIESYSHTIKLLREKLAAETKCVEALQAEVSRLEKMPEVVREFLDIARPLAVHSSIAEHAISAVEAHYSPPFKFEVGGIYIREPYGHDELELLKILDDRMLFYLKSYSEVAWTDSKGQTNGWKIVKRVR